MGTITYGMFVVDVILFLGLVLGFERRDNYLGILGICLILAAIIASFFLGDIPLNIKSLFAIAIGVLMYKGDEIRNVLFTIAYSSFINGIITLMLGVELVASKGTSLDWPVSICANLISFVIIIILGIMLKNKRKQIRKSLPSIPIPIIILFILVLYGMQISVTFSSGYGDEEMLAMFGINKIRDGVLAIAAFISFLLLCMLTVERKALRRALNLNQKCIDEQVTQYKLITKRDKELGKFRHDFNKHMNLIGHLASEGEYEKLSEYISDLGLEQRGQKFLSTNSLICDAIVNDYLNRCEEKGIDFEIIGRFPEEIKVKEPDLCVIVSNGLANALEAAEKCEKPGRVEMEIKSNKNKLFLTIRNSSSKTLILQRGMPVTDKRDKDNHGMGTLNMKETVEKYNGNITWKQRESGMVITEIQI